MVSGSTHPLVSIKPASLDTAAHTIGSEKAKLEEASAAVYAIGFENAKVCDCPYVCTGGYMSDAVWLFCVLGGGSMVLLSYSEPY